MRSTFPLSLLITLTLGTPAGAAAQQELVTVLPVNAEVRFAILGSFSGRLSSGQIQAIDGCPYVRWSMGRDQILGVPLADVVRIQVNASDVEDGQTDRQLGASEVWLEVDMDAVLRDQPAECRDQPFTKMTPLHTGVLIRQ